MRKLACTVVVVIIVFSALMFVQPSHAAYVNGNITLNTTWTRANSPYQLTGTVTVNPGVTLAIEAGTTVNLGSYQLQVNGALNARGTSTNKIVFTSSVHSSQKIEFTFTSAIWNETTSSGCIIDNAIINWVNILASGGAPKISNNYITSNQNRAITVSGGSAIISNNVITFSGVSALYIGGGSATISSNTISGDQQNNGIDVQIAGSATISSNNIVNCWEGIDTAGYCTITQNNIINNQNDGIHSTNSGTLIQSNALANNKVGVSGATGTLGVVQNNTISNNWGAGIWGPTSSATIQYNNFVNDNTQNMHLTETNVNVTAINNWWGTADQEAINQTIWDHKSASNLGAVNFVPFLTQLNTNAPTVPSSIAVPTPPPTPAPISTPTPTPTASPTPTIRPNTTPTPTPTQQPYSTPSPYQYPTPTPYNYETPSFPTETPDAISNGGGEMDLTSVAVIVVAVMATLVIVFAINRTFARGSRTQPQPATNPT